MAYAFIAAAMGFGGVAAFMLFNRPSAPQIVVVESSKAGAVPQPPASIEAKVGTTEAIPSTTASSPEVAQKPSTSGGTKSKTAAPVDAHGFSNNVPGPTTTKPVEGPAGQLSQGEIAGVVNQNRSIMKRRCWQPALEASAVNGRTTARVKGSIVIGASGQVESASASGAERDFPNLASCIAAGMKTWRFPPSGGSTPVEVPFLFASQ